MKIEYLFSKNKKIGSRLISWAASHEELDITDYPSHIAILLNEMWVVESTFGSGVRVVPYFKWRRINHELHRIPCFHKYRDSREVMEQALNVWGKRYDWLGIMYFGLAYLKLILFKKPLPSHNKWQTPSRYFCTEYAGRLSGQDFSMKSPAKVCDDWLGEIV